MIDFRSFCPVKCTKKVREPLNHPTKNDDIQGGSRLNENTVRDGRLNKDVKVMMDGEINIQSMLFDCDITPVV